MCYQFKKTSVARFPIEACKSKNSKGHLQELYLELEYEEESRRKVHPDL